MAQYHVDVYVMLQRTTADKDDRLITGGAVTPSTAVSSRSVIQLSATTAACESAGQYSTSDGQLHDVSTR